MNAKLSLHFCPGWYALLLLHVSYIRRFWGRYGKTLDPWLSSKRIPNETARWQLLTAVEMLKKPTNYHGWRYVKKSRRQVQTRLRRTNSGLRYPSSSIVVSSAIPGTQYQTSHANNTTVSNTCNPAFYYASTCTLCVDPPQARPTKCCGRRSRYNKTCSFYISSRV